MKAVKSIAQLGEIMLHHKAKFLLGLGAVAAGGLLSYLLRGRKKLPGEAYDTNLEAEPRASRAAFLE